MTLQDRRARAPLYTDLEIVQEQTLNVPEHQVLLSFNNDIGAIAFQEWWNVRGADAYARWVKDQLVLGNLQE